MNGKGRTIVVGLVLVTMMAAFGGTASAAVTYVEKMVRVPYKYYEWQTVTKYRTVRQPVTRTFYRIERRVVTTYETRRRLVTRPQIHFWGGFGQGHVWIEVRVPIETVEYVRVPYEKIVYEEVEESYTERIRVRRIGYRMEKRWVAVEITTPHFSVTFGHHPHLPAPKPPTCRTVRKTKQVVRAPGAAHPTVYKTRTERVTSRPLSGGTKTVIRTKTSEKTKGVPKQVTRSKETIRRKRR